MGGQVLNDLTELSSFSSTDLLPISSDGSTLKKATFSNLCTGAANTMRTNCITDIPQDIHLELNSGDIILKAGSVVYVPNGVDVFDRITIQNDVSVTYAGAGRGTCMLFYQPDADTLGWYAPSDCQSGTVESGSVFYDTSANTIKFVSENERASLPLGLINESNGSGITDIIQVFNGVGYIGLTAFVLPGVKGLIPDGRYLNGAPKNIVEVNSSVTTFSFDSTHTGPFVWSIHNGVTASDNAYYVESDIKPTRTNFLWYNPVTNTLKMSDDGGATLLDVSGLIVGFFYRVQGTGITKLYASYPYQPLEGTKTTHLVESYTFENYWYRVWSDGRCEQGGIYNFGSSAQTVASQINLLIPYGNTNYACSITPSRGTTYNTATSMMCGVYGKQSANFSFTWLGINTADTTQYLDWMTSGYLS